MTFTPECPNWSAVSALRVDGETRQTSDTSVALATSAGPLSITISDDCLRLQAGNAVRNDYGMLVGPVPAESLALHKSESEFVIESKSSTICFRHHPVSFEWRNASRIVQQSATDGHFARERRLAPFARTTDGWIVNLELHPDEAVFGLGEKWSALDRRGQLVHSHNRDALGVNAEASYKNAPVAWSTGGWGLVVHTHGSVYHAVGFPQWSHRAYGLLVDDDTLDLFLIRADSPARFLQRYTDLFGRAPVPPRWSTGVILSKAYYRDADEVLTTAKEVRRRRMPCDVITLDGRAWQDTDTRFNFEWCPNRYPDPEPVIRALHDLSLRVCVWEYPLVSVRNVAFKDMAAKGWFLRRADDGEVYRYAWEREPFGDVLTPLPDSGIIDFTHPEAYAYWRDRHRELFEAGVDMIKADFGEQVADDMLAFNGETGRRLHNVYSLLYNRCVYEGAERYSRNGAFLFSRSGWIGSHRYPSLWGGDPQADWQGFAASLRGGLSWGLSGGPYYATDVGGFYADQRDPALYVRWLQASVYSAHLRLHGIGAREPWSYGPTAEKAAMKALRWRYRMLPYIRRAMVEASQTGLPVQRAMVVACPDDPLSWRFDTQFFCGSDLLVAPCIRPDGGVTAYLPAGDWVRFPTGERYTGGRIIRPTLSLDEDLVFARAGTKIPLGPEVEHTGQLAANEEAIDAWWS